MAARNLPLLLRRLTAASLVPNPVSALSRRSYIPRACYSQIRSRALSAHEVFAPLTRNRPVFRIKEPIEVIREPQDFYQQLLRGIRNARHRIYLSSLYLGSEETELVSALDKALSSRPNLQVHILLDCLRGTRTDRNGKSSALLLASLVGKHGADRVRVSLYHTPALSGISKQLWPQRYNETFGLQHIKLYMFDNDTIISGANLSRDYFTNRQDRYMRIRDRALSDFFAQLVRAIGRFSFELRNPSRGTAYDLRMNGGFADPSREPQTFIRQANEVMATLLYSAEVKHALEGEITSSDTLVIPTVQMNQLGITQDRVHMDEFFQITSKYGGLNGCRNLMASAYFNFSDFHKENVLSSRSRWDLLVASPSANGFYTAKGVSKYIPDMYSIIEYEFLRAARKRMRGDISVEEYARDGWTYHGKGVWCYLDNKLPQLTMIGSPNYGYRSMYCDLEAQITLIPASDGSPASRELQKSLHQEALFLLSHSKMVNESELKQRIRGSPLWLHALKPFILKKM
ncbi:CDP-diacylglycerol--glycerol-3-phosphate 3-phosphatidyltransferase [Coemansia interrupta]|uniref:CDP-diacylglycerol--glycerol-3-phosphate 3-phosphatidyltransferase n=1 Tax=Coemansia interrupta TaxID=1126814 RepID=A0A9W8LNV1_9FUNG|nr:CDP-diacylglycerol--glycerol-3-phosphate 3-phosphatidyltransferase [Coemansia interrupta]